ncbi:class I SAM-dependent methyltransferase [Pelagibacteraceae bacterium]|nr:class I SAM-dependent methyltransferase [Pelagibacteraceae bacterium]
MYIDFYKNIEKYINSSDGKKVLILNDPYYSFNATIENISIKDNLSKISNNKKIIVVEQVEDFLELKDSYEIIVNIFFSSVFINQLKFFNQIIKISVFETRFINILPFSGFINYSFINFNPIFFNFINIKNNFEINEVAFLDKYGKKIKVKENYIKKIFFQTTEKRNQSFIDYLYNEINKNFSDTAIMFDLIINKLELIDFDFYKPKRLGHHLSGHGNKTWVDEGSFKKINELIDIKSMVDVGCGPGGMVKYTKDLGIKSIGIDGDNSIIRDIEDDFYLHDYTKGYFNTELTFDLCWCVEFLEHVDSLYADNYFDTFKKCKYVFCTFAPKGKGGYHHVNTQDEAYWKEKFDNFNFKYLEEDTKLIRLSSTITKNFIRDHGLFFKNNLFS